MNFGNIKLFKELFIIFDDMNEEVFSFIYTPKFIFHGILMIMPISNNIHSVLHTANFVDRLRSFYPFFIQNILYLYEIYHDVMETSL